MLRERSIDIVMSELPPEPASAEAVVVPLNVTESLVAVRGLGRHLDILYKGILKSSDSERALLGVYNFIAEDVEDYRTKALNLARSLDPSRSLQGSREMAALAITYFITGQRSHRTGVWLNEKAREKQQVDKFHEVMLSDELTFFELNEWAIKQTVLNDRFWRQQLQTVRTHPRIIDLREAIESSDHQIEV